jgi:nickel-dependent lactate racemase
MTQLFFHLGKGRIVVDVPESKLVGVHSPPTCESTGEPTALIDRSLSNTIGLEQIPSQIRGGEKALIILDDVTRETPTRVILPQIVDRLESAGVKDEDIQIIFALGTHRYMAPEEMESRAGPEAMKRFQVFNHYWREEEKLRDLGTTHSGIPIMVNSKILEADWSIGIGTVAPHRIAGYTGGGKIVQPGLSGAETTALTHLMAAKLESEEVLGVPNNPVRTEMEEIAAKAGLSMISNCVLDGKGRLVNCFSGDVVAAHREAVKTTNDIYDVPIDHKVDIALVDSFPADIDMWQAVKAIQAAERSVKPGGTIVLFSPCWEGISREHPELEKYGYLYPAEAQSLMDSGELRDTVSTSAMFHIGRIRERFRIIVYTVGVSKRDTETLGFEYASNPQEAVDMALEGAGKSTEILAFKRAALIVPRLGDGS